MDAKLVLVGGDANPAEIKLRLPVIIGRGRQATLILPHPLVSRKHCEIVEYEGYLIVKDLGSLNGTYVNQRRVQQAVLPSGGLLTLGPLSFRAVYSSWPPGARPADACTETVSLHGDDQPSADLPDTGHLGDARQLGRFDASDKSTEPEIDPSDVERGADAAEHCSGSRGEASARGLRSPK
jgi:predicted component of type VI protein secretion system